MLHAERGYSLYPTVHARYYIGPECPSIKQSSVRTSPVSLMAIADAGIWSFCLIALAIFCGPCRLPAESFTQVFDFAPANPLVQRNRLALLGTLRLNIEAPDGKPLHGLSGLVWLPRTKLLYAVSDQGYLVWLKSVRGAQVPWNRQPPLDGRLPHFAQG